ncbi:MAG TPA: tetratricopeptide repeat-containing protein kinase family protein, partial [Longimicrobium sp.]|nr:tetratricopeptide repeat-containing protein kinase family protein [Longimicrobium sp.]
SDQFCFCIVLYEALYGERPFEGVHLARLEDQINQGEVRPAPAGSSVPAELRRILLRGLSARPADRFPGMEPLLEALSRVRDPRQARRRWMASGAAAGALTLLLVGGGYLAAIEGRVCAGAGERLSGLWDPPRKDTIRQAFLATGKPYAEDAWKTVERVLDTYARAWVDQRTDACVATKVRHEWSEEQMGLRVLCLERQRKQLEALTRVFAEADAAAVENAVTAVSALPDARLCGDVVALSSRVKPPESPVLRTSVDAVRGQLAEAAALLSSGKEPRAFELAKAAAAAASGLNHPPVEAEALALRGQLEAAQQADYKTAEKTLDQAVFAAEASGHDEAAVRAFTHLVAVVGDKLGRPEEGLRYARHAEALLTALGGDDRLRAELLQQRGAVLASQGRRQEALAARQEALALAEKVYPAEHPTVAIALSNVGWALFEQGEDEQALSYQRRALPLLERDFGKAHPRVALVLMRIGNIVNARGDTAEAERSNRRALAILEGAFGPNHARVAGVKQTLGMALYNQGRNDEALTLLLSALDVHEKAFGELNLRVSSNLMAVGECLIHQGRFDEARGFLQRARAINAKLLGADNVQQAPVLTLLGEVARGQGRREEALRLFLESLEVQRKALGPDSPALATDLTRAGTLLWELGQGARATAMLERALALRGRLQSPPDELGDTQFALARVLWQNPATRARAKALVASARENLVKAGAVSGETRKQLDAWLARHAP